MTLTTEKDKKLLAKMRTDPPGTVRTLDEKFAFEHDWDDRVNEGAAWSA